MHNIDFHKQKWMKTMERRRKDMQILKRMIEEAEGEQGLSSPIT